MLHRRVVVVVWMTVLLFPLIGFTGTISGLVRDAAGATLNGVFISAHRSGATFTTTVYSDDTGQFRFPELRAGAYTVTVHAGGFQTQHRSNLAVETARLCPSISHCSERRVPLRW